MNTTHEDEKYTNSRMVKIIVIAAAIVIGILAAIFAGVKINMKIEADEQEKEEKAREEEAQNDLAVQKDVGVEQWFEEVGYGREDDIITKYFVDIAHGYLDDTQGSNTIELFARDDSNEANLYDRFCVDKIRIDDVEYTLSDEDDSSDSIMLPRENGGFQTINVHQHNISYNILHDGYYNIYSWGAYSYKGRSDYKIDLNKYTSADNRIATINRDTKSIKLHAIAFASSEPTFDQIGCDIEIYPLEADGSRQMNAFKTE